MESIYNKEKKLETVLEKLTNLSRSSKSYAGNIDDLYLEKNQLQSEKNEIENKYKQLLLEYNNLKQKLKTNNKSKSEKRKHRQHHANNSM